MFEIIKSIIRFLKKGNVSLLSLAVFTRQFAVMYKSGISIIRVLDGLSEQTECMRLKIVLKEISRDLKDGKKVLLGAFQKHPDVFPPIYLAMIDVGAKSGGKAFSTVLERLAENLERQNSMRRKVISSLSYPVIIICVAFLVIFASAYFILPQLMPILTTFNVEKPLPTRILLKTVNIFSNLWLVSLIIIIIYLLASLLLHAVKTPKGREVFENILLAAPVVNTFIIRINVVYFCRTVSLLYSSGIPLLDVLCTTRNVLMLNIFKQYMDGLAVAMKNEGIEMHTYLMTHPLFPIDLTQIIHVGERTGDIPNVLDKLAEMYELQVESSLDTMVHLLEPALMLSLGAVVFFILAAVFLPLYSLFSDM